MGLCKFNIQCSSLCVNYSYCVNKFIKEKIADMHVQNQQKLLELTDEITKLKNKIVKINKENDILQKELHSLQLTLETKEQVENG